MMMLAGQSNRIWHYWAGRFPGRVGLLVGPSYVAKVPIDPWMPLVLDNDAFICWKNGVAWELDPWVKMLHWIRMRGGKPLWALCPDVVGNREATIANWSIHHPTIDEFGWRKAFAVQDGMTPKDVPKNADLVFVGGTDSFKWRTVRMWTEHFARVHVGRINNIEKVWLCEDLGVESVDGTGWFKDPSREDKLPSLQLWVERHRNIQPELIPA